MMEQKSELLVKVKLCQEKRLTQYLICSSSKFTPLRLNTKFNNNSFQSKADRQLKILEKRQN